MFMQQGPSIGESHIQGHYNEHMRLRISKQKQIQARKKLNNLAFFTQLALSYTINCYLRIINIELYGKKWNATLD